MNKKTCGFEGCGRPYLSRGMCIGHYNQWRNGKPLTPLRRYKKRKEAPEGYAYCIDCESFKKEEEFSLYPNGKPKSYCKRCTSNRVIRHNRKKAAA